MFLLVAGSVALIKYDEVSRFLRESVEIDLVVIDHANKVAHLFEVK